MLGRLKREEAAPAPAPAPMDVDGSADAAPPAPPPKKKRIVKKKEIPIVATNSSLDKSIVESYRELESQIHATDKLVMGTEVNIIFLFLFSSTFVLRFYSSSSFRTVKTLLRSTYMIRVVN
jgi:hypothetical protein